MSLWDDVESDAADVLLNTDDLAETVTYAPLDGDAVSVAALIDRGAFMGIQVSDGEVETRSATVYVAQAVVTDPQWQDQMSFAERRGGTAVDWVVTPPWRTAGALWALTVVRVEPKTRSAGAYRRDLAGREA